MSAISLGGKCGARAVNPHDYLVEAAVASRHGVPQTGQGGLALLRARARLASPRFQAEPMTLTVPDPRRPRRLSQYAEACRTAQPQDQAELIRQALKLTPPCVPARIVEVMIAAGACESAALTIIGSEAAWMLSSGESGRCLASVVFPGMEEEVTSEGATPALALLGAWACAAIVRPAAKQVAVDPAPETRPAGAVLH
jgi:hypothetical protein